MARDIKRVNLNEAADAARQCLEDAVVLQKYVLEELARRNKGLWTEYAGRNRCLWSRLLGRLREAGMDAPEALIGSAVLLGAGSALSFMLVSRVLKADQAQR